MKRAKGDERGVTLVEVLVAIVLFGVLGSVITAGLVSATKQSSYTNNVATAESTLNTAMERLSRDVRSLDPGVLSGSSGTQLVGDVFGSTRCRRVTWQVSGTVLRRRVVIYNAPGGAAANAAHGCTTGLTLVSDSQWVTQVRSFTSGVTAFTYQTAAGGAAVSATAAKVAVLTLSSTPLVNHAAIALISTVTLRNP
jgi:prepilin-type N-terminal cleavage/methylation domain-containing protein